MVLLRNISLYQFRNYRQATFSFEKPVTCICGKNGSGKTNLLDAVYTLCYTKSYFSASVAPTVMNGTEGYRIQASFSDNDERQQAVSCKYQNGKKEISCGGLTYEKLSDHIGKYAAVMIAPDDIELINDGSELRRKFIDGMLSQCNRDYLNALIDYQRALQQRNAWLKQYARGTAENNDMLAYFDDVLDKSGSYLFACRREWVSGFAPLLQEYYALLSGGSEQVGLIYESDLHRESLKQLLERTLSEDFRYQRTMRGAHRDDLQLLMNGQPIKSYGSQGQKKSFLFALKLAQYVFLKKQMHQNPILLLDDVFEKLDQQRMESLLRIIRGADFGQVILTDTHEERIRKAFSGNEEELDVIRLNS